MILDLRSAFFVTHLNMHYHIRNHSAQGMIIFYKFYCNNCYVSRLIFLYVDAELKDKLQRCAVAIHVILTLNCSYTIHSFWLFSYLQSQQPSPWITCNINHNDSPIKPQFEITFILWTNWGEHHKECFSHSHYRWSNFV